MTLHSYDRAFRAAEIISVLLIYVERAEDELDETERVLVPKLLDALPGELGQLDDALQAERSRLPKAKVSAGRWRAENWPELASILGWAFVQHLLIGGDVGAFLAAESGEGVEFDAAAIFDNWRHVSREGRFKDFREIDFPGLRFELNREAETQPEYADRKRLAKEFGITDRQLDRWRKQSWFPAPVAVPGSTSILWDLREVREAKRKHDKCESDGMST